MSNSRVVEGRGHEALTANRDGQPLVITAQYSSPKILNCKAMDKSKYHLYLPRETRILA